MRTYSIGFKEEGFDEAPHARAVAAHLGTEHTELYVSPVEAQEVIPELPTIYDEPFADSSQVPTYLLSKLTREHVTVALSGDGGDELFAGYTRHRFARVASRMPASRGPGFGVRAGCRWASSCGSAPSAYCRRGGDRALRSRRCTRRRPCSALATKTAIAVSSALGTSRRSLVNGGMEPKGPIFDAGVARALPDPLDRMQYLDTITFLPDDILTKVDRASMAVALEVRVPILDHRIVEFSWRLPPRFKMRRGRGKWLLRQVLYRHVPKQLVERPKSGFAIPLGTWLRGPLRGWAEELLSEKRLAEGGLLNPAPIRARWLEHLRARATGMPRYGRF